MLRAQRICGWSMVLLALVLGVVTVPQWGGGATATDGQASVESSPVTTRAVVKGKAEADAGWQFSGPALAGCLALLALGVILLVKASRTALPHDHHGHHA